MNVPSFGERNVRAGDVGGHQVGRELNAARGASERDRKGFHERGLRNARNAFEQNVSAREKRREHEIERARRADVHTRHFAAQLIDAFFGGDDFVVGDGVHGVGSSLRLYHVAI